MGRWSVHCSLHHIIKWWMRSAGGQLPSGLRRQVESTPNFVINPEEVHPSEEASSPKRTDNRLWIPISFQLAILRCKEPYSDGPDCQRLSSGKWPAFNLAFASTSNHFCWPIHRIAWYQLDMPMKTETKGVVDVGIPSNHVLPGWMYNWTLYLRDYNKTHACVLTMSSCNSLRN